MVDDSGVMICVPPGPSCCCFGTCPVFAVAGRVSVRCTVRSERYPCECGVAVTTVGCEPRECVCRMGGERMTVPGTECIPCTSAVPRRSTRFIFLRHLRSGSGMWKRRRYTEAAYRSHTVPEPCGPGPHFSTHLPSLYRPGIPH